MDLLCRSRELVLHDQPPVVVLDRELEDQLLKDGMELGLVVRLEFKEFPSSRSVDRTRGGLSKEQKGLVV